MGYFEKKTHCPQEEDCCVRWIQTHGRLTLALRVLRQGRDIQVLLSGGDAHIGAVALGIPGEDASRTRLLLLPGHREDVLAQGIASRMANVLGCTVCVSVGIHYDHIGRQEIADIENMARLLTERCLKALTKDTTC